MPRVLVSDSLAPQGLEILEHTRGLEVDYAPGLAPGDLIERIRGAEGLVIRSGTKVTREVIEAATELRVIGRAGIGVDNVDLPAATARGVVVVNTPSGNNVTTAEHAIALLVALARHVPQATASMKSGKWEKNAFTGMELEGRTLGVVGLGNIGRVVASKAQGLGMRVIAFDPHLPQEVAAKMDVDLVDLDTLLSRSDAITVHVPKTKETAGLLGTAAFEKCRPGVLIVNAARGGIVDEKALLVALDAGKVGGAGLDVFEQEPPPKDSPLVQHPKVICTPHLGASTEQAQLNVAIQVAEQVRDYLIDGIVRNGVNVPSVSAEILAQVRPYLVLGEKLGRFQGQLCPGKIDEIEIEYAGGVADLRVAPITIAVLRGLLESMTDRVNMVNAPVIARERGIKVIESKSNRTDDYASTITTRVRGCVDRLIVGAVFHGTQPRIVRIDDFILEAIPEGHTLLLHNHDRPGVVGAVGTILGESGCNISRMQLALQRERNEAAMLVNLDSAPAEAVLERLRTLPHVISCQLVELEMTTLVAVGAQWGDEGKGKIVDWLATHAQVVARFQGGNNAGHTLVVDGEQTVLHLVPAGVLQRGTLNLIGPGVVVDPAVLIAELDALVARGVLTDPARVRVSGRAHVILDWNIELDKAREETRKSAAIGTTGRGIGPTYEDKVARRGIRVADLLDPASLRDIVLRVAAEKNFELREVHHWPTVDAEAIYAKACDYGRKLAPYVDHTGRLLERALREKKDVLFEGAQGTFLDIDHGTYPYVTSSNCVAGAACTGSGVGPTAIDRVLGISKAYTTRVGGGPFPTEDLGAAGERLRELGSEFGATTGRPRRCGWLDVVMLREAAIVNGLTALVINKLDILSGLGEVPIAVGYTIDGKRTDEFPMTLAELARAEPIYESLPGWTEDVCRVQRMEDLPDAARRYVDRIEALVDVPVEVVSVGPGRDQTIARSDPFRS